MTDDYGDELFGDDDYDLAEIVALDGELDVAQQKLEVAFDADPIGFLWFDRTQPVGALLELHGLTDREAAVIVARYEFDLAGPLGDAALKAAERERFGVLVAAVIRNSRNLVVRHPVSSARSSDAPSSIPGTAR